MANDSLTIPLKGSNTPTEQLNTTVFPFIAIVTEADKERQAMISKWAAQFDALMIKSLEVLAVLFEARNMSPAQVDASHFFRLTDELHGLMDDTASQMDLIEFEDLFKAVTGKDSFHCYIQAEIESPDSDLDKLVRDMSVMARDKAESDYFLSLIEAKRNGGAA